MSSTSSRKPEVPLRCYGVARIPGWPESLVFYFNAVPTDDEMRFLHHIVARAVAGLPEDLQ